MQNLKSNRLEKKKTGENLKILSDIDKRENWRPVLKVYFIGLGVFLFSLFSVLCTILLAFAIF